MPIKQLRARQLRKVEFRNYNGRRAIVVPDSTPTPEPKEA